MLVVVVIGFIAVSIGIGGNGKKIKWSDIKLGEMLPEPQVDKGEVHDNSDESLWIDISKFSDEQYNDYVDACKEKGFTVDAESNSSTYDAYNADGYKLSLSYFSDMSIKLEAPMEMSAIKWPTSTAGNMLPVPKSTTGVFSYEQEDGFFVNIGETSKDDYEEYVEACSKKGFNVDYDKGDNYYYSDNADGWHVSLKYEGNNIMSINISAPSDEDDDSATSKEEPKQDVTAEPEEKKAEKKKEDKGALRTDFKAAMDSYEEFMDKYVKFMKKYDKNPSDLELLADYADYMSKYADFVKDFEKWEKKDMNPAETAYYIKVQTRVNKKLLKVAQ